MWFWGLLIIVLTTLLVLNVGNEGMIHWLTINHNPGNPHSHPFPTFSTSKRRHGEIGHGPHFWASWAIKNIPIPSHCAIWLKTVSLLWVIIIPSKPGSIIPYSNQLTRVFLMAQLMFMKCLLQIQDEAAVVTKTRKFVPRDFAWYFASENWGHN